MRKRFQRVMAWMLTVLMILTYIPTDVWASGQNVQENEVQQEETDLSALSNESKEKSDESEDSDQEKRNDVLSEDAEGNAETGSIDDNRVTTLENEQVTVESLEIISMPYRTSYYCGFEEIEPYVSIYGIELLASYSNGHTETITADYTESPQDSYGNILYLEKDSRWLETPGEYEIILHLGDAEVKVPIKTQDVFETVPVLDEEDTVLKFEKDTSGNWCTWAVIKPSETGTYALKRNFDNTRLEMYKSDGTYVGEYWGAVSRWKLEAGESYVCFCRDYDYSEDNFYKASLQKTAGVEKVEIIHQPYSTSYVQELDRQFYFSSEGIGLRVTYDNGDTTFLGYDEDGNYIDEDKYGNYYWQNESDWDEIISKPGIYDVYVGVDEVEADEPVKIQVLPLENIPQITEANYFSIGMSKEKREWKKVIPSKSGQYNISVSEWTYIYILDENFEQIDADYAMDMSAPMDAGKTYYVCFQSDNLREYAGIVQSVPQVTALTMLQEPVKKKYIKNLDYNYYLNDLELELTYEDGSTYTMSWDEIGENGDWKDSYGNYLRVKILKDGSEGEWTSEAGTYEMVLSVQEQSVSLEIVVEEISSENVPVLTDTDQEFFYEAAGNTYVQFVPEEDGVYGLRFQNPVNCRKYNQETGGYEYYDGEQINLALSGGTACYLEISKMYEEDVSFIASVERIPDLESVTIVSEPVETSYILGLTDGEIILDGMKLQLNYRGGETTYINYKKDENNQDKYGTQVIYQGLKDVNGEVTKPGIYKAEIQIGTIVKEVQITIKSLSEIDPINLEAGNTIEGKMGIGFQYFSFTAPETKDYYIKMDEARYVFWKEKDAGALNSMWADNGLLEFKGGKTYILAVEFRKESNYKITIGKIPEIKALQLKKPPCTEYYYGLQKSLEDYELRYEVIYENGEKEILSRYDTTKYGMNLSEESPFDQWNLKDEKGNLPVGDYQTVYRLGKASMNVTISILSLEGLDYLKEGEYLFLKGDQVLRFVPKETGDYRLMFREAGNITVYDSEYEYYCGDSYGSDVLIESMDKDKTYYFVIQYSHNSGTDQAIMIEKEKTVVGFQADTSNMQTVYRQYLDNVNFDELYLKAIYDDGTREKLYDYSSGVSIDFQTVGLPLEKVGTYPVKISYKGAETTFNIECVPADTGELPLLEEDETNVIPFLMDEARKTVRFIPSQTSQYVFSVKNAYHDESIQIWDDSGECIIEKNDWLDHGVAVDLVEGKEYLISLTADYKCSLELKVSSVSDKIVNMQFDKSSIKDYYLYDDWGPGSDEYAIAVDVEYESGEKEILKSGQKGKYGAAMTISVRQNGREDNKVTASYLDHSISGTLNLCTIENAPLDIVKLGKNTLDVNRQVIYYKFTPEEDGIYKYCVNYDMISQTSRFTSADGTIQTELKKGTTYYLSHYIAPETKRVEITVEKVKEVSKIEIKKKPDKTVYAADWDYDVENKGLVIHASYSDGTDRDIALEDLAFEGFSVDYPDIDGLLYNTGPGDYKGVVSWRDVSASFDIKVLPSKDISQEVKENEIQTSEGRGRKLYKFMPQKDGVYWYVSDVYTAVKDESGHEADIVYTQQMGFQKLMRLEKGKWYFFNVDFTMANQKFYIFPQKSVADIQVKNNTVTVMEGSSLYSLEEDAVIIYEDGSKDTLNYGEVLETGGSLELISLKGTRVIGKQPIVLKFLDKMINCTLNVIPEEEYEMKEFKIGESQSLEQSWVYFKFRTSDKPYYRFFTDSEESVRLQFYSKGYINTSHLMPVYASKDVPAIVKLEPNTTYRLSVNGKAGNSLNAVGVSGLEKIEVLNKGQEELFQGEYINQDTIEAYYYGSKLKITDTDGNSWTEVYNPYMNRSIIQVGLEQQAGIEKSGKCKTWIDYCGKKITQTLPITAISKSKNLIDLGDGAKSQFKRNASRWKQVYKITPSMDGAYKINMNTLEPVWNVEIKLVDEEGQKLIDTQNNIGKAFAMEESLTKGKSYYLIITSYPLLTGEQTASVEFLPKTILVPVKEVKLNAAQLNFAKLNETKQLTASVTPENATNKTVIWTTSNEKVAQVSNGKVTSKGPGTCTITASAGGISAICKVSVKSPAEKITLNKTSATVYTGKTYTLVPDLTPSNSTDSVTWTSSNTKVAKVSSKGVVTGVAKGTATITAKTTSGKTAACKVTVKTAATKVTLSKTSVTVNKGKTYTLKATMSPSGANDSLQWSSSNSKVAKVSTSGVVTGVARGSATITVKTGSGKTASCKVTVKVPSTKVSLSKTSVSLNKGKTYTLKGTMSPSDSTDSLKWSSSNTKVAKVSSSGVVTGVEKGSAVITVKTTSGKTATCKVTVKIPSTKVTMSKTSISVNVGKTYTLKGTMSPSNTTDTLKWSSSDTKIAKVSSTGVVTAVAKGSATITVKTTSGKTATCKVTVKVPSTKVTMSKTSVSINVGKTYTLKGTMSPSNTTDTLKWSSSNTKIAKVSSTGVVTAVAKGSATITVKTTSGKTATCKVTVKVPSTKVTMSKTSVSINVGKTYTLKGTMSPSNTTDTLKWSSSNTKIAKVSSTGVVTAVAKGSATITVKTTSGKTATCKVTVKVPSTKVTMSKTSVSINKGKTYTLKGTMSPSNTTDTLKWSSSNTKVAKVSSTGVVTAVEKGTATITVKTTSGKTATCKVTVKIPSTKVALSKTSISVYKGKSYTLKGTLTPGNSTDTLKWSSSNTKVATVSGSGVVKGISAGTASITVKTSSGKTATCKVTVKEIKAASIQFDSGEMNLTSGQSVKAGITVLPANTTDSITWSSSDDSIVRVSSDGVITAVKEGEASVEAKTSSGKKCSCKITVSASTDNAEETAQ